MPFSITDAAFEGVRIVRRDPISVLMWGITYLVGFGLILLIGGAAVIGAVQAMSAADSDPAAAGRAFGGIALVYLVTIPVMILLSSVIVAATCRSVLEPEDRGFFYMRLGGAELRLMAAYLVVVLIFIGASLAFALMMALVVGGSIALGGVTTEPSSSPPAAVALIYPLYFAFLAVMIWLSTRLSLIGPITVVEGRFALARSWNATRGRVWSLVDLGAATLVRGLVVYAVALVLFVVAVMIAVAALSSGWSSIDTATPSEVLGLVLPAVMVGLVVLAAYAAVQMTVASGPFVAFYRDVVRGPGTVSIPIDSAAAK